jgi:periplasmic protein TonB
MAYADQRQGRAVAIGSVIVVHAGLAVVLLSGLAVRWVPRLVDPPLETVNIPLPPPPPLDPEPVKPQQRVEQPVPQPRPVELPFIPDPVVPTTQPDSGLTGTNILPTYDPGPVTLDPPTPPLPPQPPVSLARGAKARGNQGDWFPQDSYPAAARRLGAEGRVSLAVEVGTNGRVTACEVTSSSGNADLDQATCRLATRNGRFEPALGADGKPVASRLRLAGVRWELRD